VGSVDVFVSQCLLTSVAQCVASQLPNATHFKLSTVGKGRDDSLDITRSDTTDSRYLVGVLSNSLYASYQISASLEDTILALQAGVTISDYVGDKEMDHFSFHLDKINEKMRIILTVVTFYFLP